VIRHPGRAAALGVAVIGLAGVTGLALIDPGTGIARDRLDAASSDRLPSDARLFVANTTDELADGIHDANDNALVGLVELQLARETADPSHYARADEALRRVLELDPDNIDALIGHGTLSLARHDFAGALAIGERALALNDSSARVYGLIGDAQVELGRYDEALASIQRMVDLRPDLASYSRVSYLRELHGDLPGAIEAMELALEAGGPTVENTEYVRVQLGNLFFGMGDLEAADALFTTARAHLPGYVPATAGLARVRAAQGRLSDAIELYRDATARQPLPELVVALGETYEAAGRDADATDQYALAEAMQSLFEANGVQSDLELAAFAADHGDPLRAVDLARDAYARTPSVRAADVLGWALFKAGKVDEAAQFADDALRLGSVDVRVLFHAGLIAEAAGDADLAHDRLSDAVELNPAFSPLYAPVAMAALARLEDGR
jgi:tetratricopeptide (TPR) repeat protein